jgi:hypothetical protein
MTITSMRLVDGSSETILLPRDGLKVQGLDAGSPTVREVTEARPGTDGDLDTTALIGARAVSLDLLATQTPAAFEDELGAFLHPSRRPYLYIVDDEWAQERRLLLRYAQHSTARAADMPPTVRRIQAQFKAPDGIWEDASGNTEITILGDISDGAGLTWPLTWPISYAATAAAGAQVVTNSGTAPAYFVARLYGPCTGPSLLNVTTGEEISFTSDLVLGAGDYVEIDTREHTAYAESLPDASRLGYLDFSVSAWWRLAPGAQELRYVPATISTGSQVVIDYRPAWI